MDYPCVLHVRCTIYGMLPLTIYGIHASQHRQAISASRHLAWGYSYREGEEIEAQEVER